MEKIAVEYGDGLFELACDEKLTDRLYEETRALRQLLRDEPAYASLMEARTVPREEKDRLLKEAFEGKVHPYLYNFLALMNDRGYFGYLPSCFSRYEDRYLLLKNLKRVTVRSAVPLDDQSKERIKASVEKKLGAKIEPLYITDPSLVAGLRIEADGVLIENSAKSALDGLKRHLTSAVFGNT